MRTTYWVPGARRRGFSLVAGLALLCLAGTMVAGSPARAAEPPTAKSELLTTGDGYGQPRGSKPVRLLQRRLRTLGLRPGAVDGLFGPQTTAAVERFQHAAGLQVDGIVGPHTRGTLGRAFARICEQRGLEHVLLSRSDLDIADADSVDAALAKYEPWAVVNAAGYVRVDDAEYEVDLCYRENALGPQNLASFCARDRVALITFSTDLVFDGERGEPYVESNTPAPLNVYGRSKAEAECRVLERHPAALVVRTSAFFGPWDEYNYVTLVLRALRAGKPFLAATDLVVSPTYVPDLVNTVLDLLVDGASGIWHLTNNDAVTWSELATRVADGANVSARSLVNCRSTALDFIARRPRYSALTSSRSMLMPSLSSSLARYMALTA